MTSIHQERANGRNAQLSTGPKTEEGKQRSARNSLQHGAYAGVDPLTSGLLGENPDEVQALVDGIVDDLDPANTIEYMSAMTVAHRHISQHRVSKLFAPLVVGRQTTTEEDFEDSDHRSEYEFACELLAAIDSIVNIEDDAEPAQLGEGWFFLERQLWIRAEPDPDLKPSAPVFRNFDGTPREPSDDEKWRTAFIKSVFQRFESWDEARRWAEDLFASSEPGAIEESRRLRLAETERIMESVERFGPLQDGTDRRVARALANHATIRRQSVPESP